MTIKTVSVVNKSSKTFQGYKPWTVVNVENPDLYIRRWRVLSSNPATIKSNIAWEWEKELSQKELVAKARKLGLNVKDNTPKKDLLAMIAEKETSSEDNLEPKEGEEDEDLEVTD